MLNLYIGEESPFLLRAAETCPDGYIFPDFDLIYWIKWSLTDLAACSVEAGVKYQIQDALVRFVLLEEGSDSYTVEDCIAEERSQLPDMMVVPEALADYLTSVPLIAPSVLLQQFNDYLGRP